MARFAREAYVAAAMVQSRILFALIAVTALLLTIGCGGGTSTSNPRIVNNGKLSGRVVDSISGAPVAATVAFYSRSSAASEYVPVSAMKTTATGTFAMTITGNMSDPILVATAYDGSFIYPLTLLTEVPSSGDLGDIRIELCRPFCFDFATNSTAPATISGLVETHNAAGSVTNADVKVEFLESAEFDEFAIPLIDEASTALQVRTANGTGTYTTEVPSTGPVRPFGQNAALVRLGAPAYVVRASIPDEPNCLTARSFTVATQDHAPLLAEPGTHKVAATLTLKSCK